MLPRRATSGFAVLLIASAGAVATLTACGSGEDGNSSVDPVHVHGLGINPSDGALLIATHHGLFRSPEGSGEARRVGDEAQDTMGFTITGPDEFLASGHPAPGQGGPPHLGLIRSTDAGRSWEQVSLAGEADFHVLRAAGRNIYGFNGLSGELMASSDGGETWQRRRPPAPLIDLAVDPADERRLLAATARGLALSEDGGTSWKQVSSEVGLLAWPADGRVFLIAADGRVKLGVEKGPWRPVGSIGGQPTALLAGGADRLYAALGDGTVLVSEDGGSSWTTRSTP